ncbi:MAG: DUF3021 domain-containing protein [Nesterenkonia sp.]
MRLWIKAALLTLIPLAIMTAIGLSLISQGDTSDGRGTVVVGVIIAAVMGASVIYQIERWSLRTQSLVHLGIMVVTVLPALLLSGWFPLDTLWGYLAVIGVFTAVGVVLWSVFYLISTRLEARRARQG